MLVVYVIYPQAYSTSLFCSLPVRCLEHAGAMSLLGWEFAVLLFVTLLAYFCLGLIKVKRKNGSVFVFPSWTALLVASLVFFGFSNWVCLIYILVSSAVSYLAGLLAQRKLVYTYNTSENSTSFTFVKALGHVKDGSRKGRISLILSILVNVVILVVLNYFNFFSESVASIFKIDPVIYDFIVPIGLSFYTFTLIAYNVDCYRRTYECETNFFKFLLFVSYFPRVLQGPISSIQRLREDGFYENHSFSEVDFRSSFGRLGLGLFKKVFIADILGVYVDYIWNNGTADKLLDFKRDFPRMEPICQESTTKTK